MKWDTWHRSDCRIFVITVVINVSGGFLSSGTEVLVSLCNLNFNWSDWFCIELEVCGLIYKTVNLTADSVMWSRQVRDRNVSLSAAQVSSLLKLRLPWQRREGGWASACCAFECHNASWVAISLDLPSIRQEWVCEEDSLWCHRRWRQIYEFIWNSNNSVLSLSRLYFHLMKYSSIFISHNFYSTTSVWQL